MIKNTFLILVISIITACASSPYIQIDSDINYDLSSYKSYMVESPNLESSSESISINPILIQRIARSIDSSLETKGLNSSETPDLIVRFFLGTKREVDLSLIHI